MPSAAAPGGAGSPARGEAGSLFRQSHPGFAFRRREPLRAHSSSGTGTAPRGQLQPGSSLPGPPSPLVAAAGGGPGLPHIWTSLGAAGTKAGTSGRRAAECAAGQQRGRGTSGQGRPARSEASGRGKAVGGWPQTELPAGLARQPPHTRALQSSAVAGRKGGDPLWSPSRGWTPGLVPLLSGSPGLRPGILPGWGADGSFRPPS